MCFVGSRPNLERGPVRNLKNRVRDQEKLLLPSDLWSVARIGGTFTPAYRRPFYRPIDLVQ